MLSFLALTFSPIRPWFIKKIFRALEISTIFSKSSLQHVILLFKIFILSTPDMCFNFRQDIFSFSKIKTLNFYFNFKYCSKIELQLMRRSSLEISLLSSSSDDEYFLYKFKRRVRIKCYLILYVCHET